MSNLISGTSSNNNFLNKSNENPLQSLVNNNALINPIDKSSFNNINYKSNQVLPLSIIDDTDNPSSQNTQAINKNESLNSDNNVYNFPWDIKLKPKLDNVLSTSTSSSQLTDVDSAQSKNANFFSEKFDIDTINENVHSIDISKNQSEKYEESQYCAPWDLKLQEEMLKMMSQKEQNQAKISTVKNNSPTSSFKRDDIRNISIKQKYTQKLNQSSSEIDINQNLDTLKDEYSLPWELKQTILLQNLSSSATKKSNSSSSTLTSKNINQHIKKLSPRSSTSSSSSSHSSTSSISTNSHSSMPPPSLPPQMPPPPLPLTAHSSLSSNSLSIFTPQHDVIHQSCYLAHKQTPQVSSLMTTNQINSVSVLTSIPINNSHSNINNSNVSSIMPTNKITVDSSVLNHKNKFFSWGSTDPSNINSSDTCSNNSFDDSAKLFRQISTRNSNKQFVFPLDSASSYNNEIISNEIQVAVPVTALIISNSSTLKSNLLPLTQQISVPSLISSSSHMSILERQTWYHGRITRKQAETVLSNKQVGSFLVRQSESGNANDFSLSLVSGSGCVHMRISLKNGEFILGQCSQPFSNIVKMIEHYGKVEVPIKGAQHVKLKTPVSKINED